MIWILCIAGICGIFLADLRIKNFVERMEFPDSGKKKVLGGRLILRRYHNRGAMLGLGERFPGLVVFFSVALTLFVAVLFGLSMGQRGNRLLRAGLSLLLGGAFSNTYDRLKRSYVVDYLSFGVPWKRFQRIAFNLSDFCIMTGALLTAIGGMR